MDTKWEAGTDRQGQGISSHLTLASDDYIERLLRVGCDLDWITPLAATIQDAVRGGGHTFAIPEGQGWLFDDLRALLSRYGIDSWGYLFYGDCILFSVEDRKAEWAQNRLLYSGVPLVGGLIEPDRRPLWRRMLGW